MSIFKTEVPAGIVCNTDTVVSATICDSMVDLPGMKKTSSMDVQNTQRGAVRRVLGEK